MRRALTRLERRAYAEIVRAMRDTARYGESKVVQAAQKARPFSPIAQRTYVNSWVVKSTGGGAILGNSAYHAYHVEVGRRPGRKPPLSAILAWADAKNFAAERKPLKKRKKKPGESSRPQLGLKKPGASVSQGRSTKARRPRKRTFSQAFGSFGGGKDRALRAFAFYVQAKIGRRGYRGRYILKSVLPAMGKFLKKSMKRGIQKAISKPK